MFITLPQKKHNGSLYDFYGIYEVCVEDFTMLLRRRVFTGLIDFSCFFLALYFLVINCTSATLMPHHIISCTTSCAPSASEILLREIPTPSQMLPKSDNSADSLNSSILSFRIISNLIYRYGYRYRSTVYSSLLCA